MSRAVPPLAPHADSHFRVVFDVADVACRAPVLHDDPEHVSVKSVSDGRSTGLPGPAASGLEDRGTGGSKPQPKDEPIKAVGNILRKTLGYTPLELGPRFHVCGPALLRRVVRVVGVGG